MEISLISETVFLSLKTGILAVLLNLPGALLLSFFLDRIVMKKNAFIEGIINLPLVLPPVTMGYVLLLLLGKRGIIGAWFYALTGRSIAFSYLAALIASMLVSFPLMIRSIRTAMNMVDPRLEKAAMTLGSCRIAVFLRVTMPLIIPGVVTGALLGFARSLGEFGATITFAGNIQGETRTIPLAVYTLIQVPGKEMEAAMLVSLSVGLSFFSLFISSLFERRAANVL